jgi:hypothetical protein
MVFDGTLRDVKPKFIPVAPLVAGARNQLDYLHRGLAGLRRKRTRPKLGDFVSNHPLLPVQAIVLRKDFDRWLSAVRSRRPDILRQSYCLLARNPVNVTIHPCWPPLRLRASSNSDIVFDETNGSQVEQVDLDELDDEEASYIALRNMSIGDVCPKESEEPPQAQDQPSSSMQASPPTQDEDQAQDDENEDQEEPPQEEDNDQGGDANDDQDKEDDQGPRPPYPRVHQAIQRDHPMNSILGDIHKGVTTRSRVTHFCEHYSFVSSIEPYRVEGALRDSDWVLAM